MRDAIERGWDERTVTVNREKLLTTLRENRRMHKIAYDEAVTGYRDVAQKKLREHIDKAMKKLSENKEVIALTIDKFDPKDPPNDQVMVLQGVMFTLRVPKDHTRSYDVAIQMSEWEVGDTIELTQSQFQCFVMDDWDWREEFDTVTASYSGASGSRR